MMKFVENQDEFHTLRAAEDLRAQARPLSAVMMSLVGFRPWRWQLHSEKEGLFWERDSVAPKFLPAEGAEPDRKSFFQKEGTEPQRYFDMGPVPKCEESTSLTKRMASLTRTVKQSKALGTQTFTKKEDLS